VNYFDSQMVNVFSVSTIFVAHEDTSLLQAKFQMVNFDSVSPSIQWTVKKYDRI
jgi:hypothetical protein